jgi:hypothetical protein
LETLQKADKKANEKTKYVESISYALAKEMKTNDFYVQNSKNYKSAQFVDTLPLKNNISDGVIETVDEVKTKICIKNKQ